MGRDNIILGFGKVTNIGVGLITVSASGASKASGLNLGLSDGGIEVSPKVEVSEIDVDNSTGVIKRYKTKETLEIKASIAEADLAKLQIGMGLPDSALVASTLKVGGDWTLPELTVYIDTNGVNGGTRQYTVYIANIYGDVKHSYKKKEKTMIPITIAAIMDISRTVGDQFWTVTDSNANTTAPTIVLTTPAAGGTVVKNTKGTVLLTITSPNTLDQSSFAYGKGFIIVNITTPSTPVLVAGSIVYDSVAKTITFTPTSNWNASDILNVHVSGLKDVLGNVLATPYLAEITVTA